MFSRQSTLANAVSDTRQCGDLMKVGDGDILDDGSGKLCRKHCARSSKSLEPYLGNGFSVPAEQGCGSEARAASLNERVKSKVSGPNLITSISFGASQLNALGEE